MTYQVSTFGRRWLEVALLECCLSISKASLTFGQNDGNQDQYTPPHLAQPLPLPDRGHGSPVQDPPHPLAGPAGPDQALGLPPALVMVDQEVLEVVGVRQAVVRELAPAAPAARHLEPDRQGGGGGSVTYLYITPDCLSETELELPGERVSLALIGHWTASPPIGGGSLAATCANLQ